MRSFASPDRVKTLSEPFDDAQGERIECLDSKKTFPFVVSFVEP